MKYTATRSEARRETTSALSSPESSASTAAHEVDFPSFAILDHLHELIPVTEGRSADSLIYLNAVFDTMKIGLLRHIMPGKGLITRAFTVQPVHSAAL